MAILINETTRFLIQGITGKQGSRACQEMLDSGAKVMCGVTPGKGGEDVFGIPVYNSIKEAMEKYEVDASVIYVPPRLAKEAITEAINSGIKFLNVVTENIPVHDMANCLALAKENDCRIVGATSAGIYSVGRAKCGSIAGGKSKIAFSKGNIGILSRSGGMSCETALVLTQAGLGQSTVVSTGSDILMGTQFVELVQEFEKDPETKGIAIFGEIGGTAEEDLAEYLMKRRETGKTYPKPIVAFISGKFAKGIQNISLGHAGAIIEGNKGTRAQKVKLLKEAGVDVVEVHHLLGEAMKRKLEGRQSKMEFKTRISKIENDDVIIRGEKLSDLVKTGKFSDAIFLEISGRKPSEKESELLERMLISVMDHGMGVTSSLTSRFIASGGNKLHVGVGAGILSLGDYHGGAIEPAMKMFYELFKLGDQAKEKVKEMIINKEIIYGFGHKHYKDEDPRVRVLLEEMKKIGFISKYLSLKNTVEEAFAEVKGRVIHCNVDGILAVFLCDFGLDPLLGKGIFIIGRTPGLVAQTYEELKYEKPVRRIPEEEIEYIGE